MSDQQQGPNIGPNNEEMIDCSEERTVRMLYAKLGRPALGKTMKLVGQAAAEEIVQDVFTKLWHKKMKFSNLRSAYAWVYKCCTNGAIDFLRSHGNQHDSLTMTDDEGEAHGVRDVISESDVDRDVQAKQAWLAVARHLSEEEANVFVYRNLEGLSQDEVAEVMQISRRSVNRLQEKLDAKLEKFRRRRHVG